MAPMSMSTSVIDLAKLRSSCAQCSLQQLCLPAGVDRAELQRLDAIVRRKRRVERGANLFRAGDVLDAVHIARDGAFKTVYLSEEGDEQVVGFHLPGELIGLDALGSGRHRCDAVALTAANVCEVPMEQLTAVAAQLPSLQQQLLRVIGRSVGRDQDHMRMLVRRQADERVALFLHGLQARLHNIGGASDTIELPMSRADIGQFLGLALETVSRGFTRLQEHGVIGVEGRRISVLDQAALQRIAHGAETIALPQRRAGSP